MTCIFLEQNIHNTIVASRTRSQKERKDIVHSCLAVACVRFCSTGAFLVELGLGLIKLWGCVGFRRNPLISIVP